MKPNVGLLVVIVATLFCRLNIFAALIDIANAFHNGPDKKPIAIAMPI